MNRTLLKNTLILMAICYFIMCMPCYAEFYRYNIDDLARKAKVRIQEIEKKIAEEEAAKELKDILAELESLYKEAESLFAEKRYEEAITVYRKIDKMSRDSGVAGLLKEKK